ncbi:hypothetical protein HK100_006568 [Physocladia obscura]|uniref:Coatomer subunit alpha n=1 Tax=Physocladia obscura TaxID=109957 RepID=A0AAD5SSA3_9FUNG|nr:hypothetical protein HK100_006568 [Physocladia obscura]
MYDFLTANDVPLLSIKKSAALIVPPRTMSYNSVEHYVLIFSPADGGLYEIYNLHTREEVQEASENNKKWHGDAAVFIGHNRFAVLSKSTQQIFIKDLTNQPMKTIKIPSFVNNIFSGGSGKNLILVTPTSAILFDTDLKMPISELNVSVLVIATNQLKQLCMLHETIKIKSGAWDETGIFIYSTQNHIKYALPQGDAGIIRTTEQTVYLNKINGKSICGLDRHGKIRVITIDPSEYRFKLALAHRKYDEVLYMIRTSNLVGQSIISYLQKKGYPEVALHFVKDSKTRLELALQCGNLEIAEENAKILDRQEFWEILGQEALRQGNNKLFERVLQRIQSYDRLSFLYFITGNTTSLKKMIKIAELRGDVMSGYQNSLYLGDVEEQIRLLKQAGQLSLAYMAAKTHGFDEDAAGILKESGLEFEPNLALTTQLLKPPAPILKQYDLNWPQLTASRSFFESAFISANTFESSIAAATIAVEAQDADWNNEDTLDQEISQTKPSNLDLNESEEDGWNLDGGLELPDVVIDMVLENTYTPPAVGQSASSIWVHNSQLAVDHIAAGSFETAMQILNRQLGVTNFVPLKEYFISIFFSSKAYLPANPSVTPLSIPLRRSTNGGTILPFQPMTVDSIISKLQEAYTRIAEGKFSVACNLFLTIIYCLLFTVATNKSEGDEIQQLLVISREYILWIKMELTRRSSLTKPKRAVELAAYFTHCQLQLPHLQRVVLLAMTVAYKYRNFNTACRFAHRLIEMGAPEEMALKTSNKARKLLTACEKNQTDEIILEYNEHNPFVACAKSFTPIYHGHPLVTCPYCSSSYKPEYKGLQCNICTISVVGTTGTGLKSMK